MLTFLGDICFIPLHMTAVFKGIQTGYSFSKLATNHTNILACNQELWVEQKKHRVFFNSLKIDILHGITQLINTGCVLYVWAVAVINHEQQIPLLRGLQVAHWFEIVPYSSDCMNEESFTLNPPPPTTTAGRPSGALCVKRPAISSQWRSKYDGAPNLKLPVQYICCPVPAGNQAANHPEHRKRPPPPPKKNICTCPSPISGRRNAPQPQELIYIYVEAKATMQLSSEKSHIQNAGVKLQVIMKVYCFSVSMEVYTAAFIITSSKANRKIFVLINFETTC